MFFGLLFSRNAKKTDATQSIKQTLWFGLNRSVPQTFKSSSCKKVFRKCACHWYKLFRWLFFFLCNNWKQCFLHKFVYTQRLDTADMLLRSLKQAFWKSPHFTSIIFTIILQWYQRFKIKIQFLKNFYQKKLFADSISFTLSHFVNAPHFSL